MSTNFISDFMKYNSGSEVHQSYLRWSAINTICVAAGLRYALRQGRIKIRPNMYILLVGDQGLRKTFAKDQARDLIEGWDAEYPIGADLTTRDDLVKFMANEITERMYIDTDGTENIYHPIALYINEFKHFLSYNPVSMLSLIVDIFDRTDRIWKCSTVKRGQESITRPFLNILACENTDWLVNQLKQGIITGGLSRRFIVVFEDTESEACVPRPFFPDDHAVLYSRMQDHIRMIASHHREYEWDADAIKTFDLWYVDNKKKLPEDKILRGFMRTKDQMLLKLVIALDLSTSDPKFRITKDGIELALTWFDAIEPNMPKLYQSAGRNELALPQQHLLDTIKNKGGLITEKEFFVRANKELSTMEQQMTLQQWERMELVVKRPMRWPTHDAAIRTWIVMKSEIKSTKLMHALNDEWHKVPASDGGPAKT